MADCPPLVKRPTKLFSFYYILKLVFCSVLKAAGRIFLSAAFFKPEAVNMHFDSDDRTGETPLAYKDLYDGLPEKLLGFFSICVRLRSISNSAIKLSGYSPTQTDTVSLIFFAKKLWSAY